MLKNFNLILILIVFNLSFFNLTLTETLADSFTDLVYEVSADSGESVSTSRRVILSTFKKITDRLIEDRATSIPEFARFYTQDKEKKSQKDKEGYWISPKTVRYPKCTILKALKRKLERHD